MIWRHAGDDRLRACFCTCLSEFRMPEPQLPSGSAAVNELMDAATRVFRLTLPKSLPIAMFAILSVALSQMYWQTTGKPMDLMHPPMDATYWTLSSVGFLGYELLCAVLMLRQRALLLGRAPDLRKEFRDAVTRWPTLVAAKIMAWLMVTVGLLALAVPGVFLLVCFLLLRPVVLFENCGPWSALLRCLRLARPRWVKVLATFVIAALVLVICLIAAAACLQILAGLFTSAAAKPPAFTAFAAACGLGVEAVAWVYFSALWLVLYSAASSSA
jgi:hypothetical protein